MRTLLVATAVASFFAITANAQTAVPANQRYCLEVRDATGPHPLLCRFTTIEQCNASKTGQSDFCMLNPELAFQQRRRTQDPYEAIPRRGFSLRGFFLNQLTG
jgi:hypothetical protein